MSSGAAGPETADTIVEAAVLFDLATRIIEGIGTPKPLALIVAASLVEANVLGHDSHGVMRLPRYVNSVRAGLVIPSASAQYIPLDTSCGRVDGGWGWGQPAAELATERAVALTRTSGVTMVTISRCNHIGRLGRLTTRAATEGMIGIATCNAEPVVAPFGGTERVLGTNPLSLACPTDNVDEPLLLDIATSATAEGKLSIARSRGTSIPGSQIVDRHGSPSFDPSAYYEGGALLPFGDHKGYGLSVFAEILGGILSGMGFASSEKYTHGNGASVLVINPAAFMDRAAFIREASELRDGLRTSRPQAGVPSVLAPGDPEYATRRRREVEGIPLVSSIWEGLMDLTEELSIVGTYPAARL